MFNIILNTLTKISRNNNAYEYSNLKATLKLIFEDNYFDLRESLKQTGSYKMERN